MNWKITLLGLGLVGFTVLTGVALGEVGYLGIFRAGLANPGAVQILADLAILGVLATLWIHADARHHGCNPWPYIVLTLAAGSFGPLCYLLRREWRADTSATLASPG